MAHRFVLIHGAWHGGWCWDGVVQALEARGHQALAPTLPGQRPGDDRGSVRFEDYVDAVVNVLAIQPEPVVLVGHSSAGFLLQAAAPRAAGKVARLVFVNAFILPDGKSQFDFVSPEAAQGLTAAAEASPDKSVPVVEDFVRGALMVGDPKAVQDELLTRLVPQPLVLFTTPVDTGAFDTLQVPKAVIYGTRDASLPPGGYLAMAQSLSDYTLTEVDASHEGLYAEPGKIAQAILESL